MYLDLVIYLPDWLLKQVLYQYFDVSILSGGTNVIISINNIRGVLDWQKS